MASGFSAFGNYAVNTGAPQSYRQGNRGNNRENFYPGLFQLFNLIPAASGKND